MPSRGSFPTHPNLFDELFNTFYAEANTSERMEGYAANVTCGDAYMNNLGTTGIEKIKQRKYR
jgi:hypothetical protein